MPRKPRIDAPGALHHILLQGLRRKKLFLEDADRDDFLDRLSHLLKESSASCYAWSLLPNQVHLLLRTGHTPIAFLMLRLLTGYVVGFHRRYRRRGQLFQSRYKSTLCQEDPYLPELVRYIHISPLRAGVVRTFSELGHYRYAGHGVLLGKRTNHWQDQNHVLAHFGRKRPAARERYKAYVKQGLQGIQEPELTGGGLIRSAGGWHAVKSLRRNGEELKGDERILGDSRFVEQILVSAEERSRRKQQARPKGYNLGRLAKRVSGLFGVKPDDLRLPRKYPPLVRARSVFCYWAVKELGESASRLARGLGISQPAVSISVRRGEGIVREMGLSLAEG